MGFILLVPNKQMVFIPNYFAISGTNFRKNEFFYIGANSRDI